MSLFFASVSHRHGCRMSFIPVFRIALALLASVLAGCDTFEDPASAKGADPVILMHAAVSGWQPDGPRSVREIASPPTKTGTGAAVETEIVSYALAPSLVIRLGEAKLALITIGTPANAAGVPQSNHGSAAMLGAYWFEKRDERWWKVAEQPNFAREGFFGDPGELRQVDLGGGKIAVAVESGSCWQGTCGKWLSLHLVGENRVTRVFDDLITSDSEGAVGRCGELLALEPGRQLRVAVEDYSSASGCYRIEGHSRFLAGRYGPGSLVIEYSGKTTSEELVPSEVAAATAEGRDGGEGEGEAPEEEYLVTVAALAERQVYHFRNGRYVLLKGRNPNPGL